MLQIKHLCGSAAVSLALALASGAVAPVLVSAPAVAQMPVSLEIFEAELAPYGMWLDHPRWGRVWSPNDLPREWRPYTTGRWIWTDEHGWYWQADETWGWIPFHYGRWAYDRRDGWLWVPGTVWGPAWVSWRESDEAYGWAPLPPEEEAEVVETDPIYWTFVAPQDFSAERIYSVRLPPQRVQVVFPRARFVYRTTVRERGDRWRGFNRGPDRVVVERRGNNRVEVRVVEPRFVDREIERRRGPNSPELQRWRERQREETVRIRARVDDAGERRGGPGNAGPGNAGGRQGDAPRRDDAQQAPTRREQQEQRQERQEQREQRQERQERQEQRQERQERQEQRQERQQQREERQDRRSEPDRRGPPPPDAAAPNEQPQNQRRREAPPETAPPAQQQQRQEPQRQEQQREQRQEQQRQAPPRQEQQQRQDAPPPRQEPRQQQQQEQRQQRQEQQQQRQERQEERQQRQEERQQRRNPPANCAPGQPGC